MIGLLAISGWIAAASYEEYFSAPIQAITTTSAYRTRCRPATATGCSVAGASAVCRFMVRIMNAPFARYFVARLISEVGLSIAFICPRLDAMLLLCVTAKLCIRPVACARRRIGPAGPPYADADQWWQGPPGGPPKPARWQLLQSSCDHCARRPGELSSPA